MKEFIKAKIEDVKTIMQMELELFSKWDRMDPIDAIDKRWFLSKEHKERTLKILDSKEYAVFICKVAGEAAGYIKCKVQEREPFLRKVGNILELYVKEEHRKKGIGEKLLSCAHKWLSENRLEWIILSTHSLDNEANEFWKKKGFKEFNKVYKLNTKQSKIFR